MKILDIYIGRIVASTTFLTLMVFISVSGIIKFVEQMKAVGRGSYDLSHAALYVLYAVPRDVEIFFPQGTALDIANESCFYVHNCNAGSWYIYYVESS